MEPTQELIDSIFAEKVRRARKMSADEKLRAGPELFQMVCEWSKMGIKAQNPDFTDEQVRQELSRRIRIGRMLDNRK